jgi:hypothetical protein
MNGNVVYLVLVINRYGVMSVTDFDAFKKTGYAQSGYAQL